MKPVPRRVPVTMILVTLVLAAIIVPTSTEATTSANSLTDDSGNDLTLTVAGNKTVEPALSPYTKYGTGVRLRQSDGIPYNGGFLLQEGHELGTTGNLSIFIAFRQINNSWLSDDPTGVSYGQRQTGSPESNINYLIKIPKEPGTGTTFYGHQYGNNVFDASVDGTVAPGFHTLTLTRNITTRNIVEKIDGVETINSIYGPGAEPTGGGTGNFKIGADETGYSGDIEIFEVRIWHSVVNQTKLDGLADPLNETYTMSLVGGEVGLFYLEQKRTPAQDAIEADLARQSTLNQVWDAVNESIVTVTATTTTTASTTVTTTVVAPPTTEFANDTRYWQTHVYSGNVTDTSAAGAVMLKPQNFTIAKPYDYELVHRSAELLVSLKFQVNNSVSAYSKAWNTLIDNRTLPGCIFKVSDPGAISAIGSSHTSGTIYCTAGNLTEGQHNISVVQYANGGTAAFLNATVLSAQLQLTDTIRFPTVNSLFVQPVLTPVFITIPTIITVTQFAGNASEIIEASSMQFGGMDTNTSWTLLVFAAVFILGLWRGYWFLAGTGLIGVLGVIMEENGNPWPLNFAGTMLLVVIAFVLHALLETRKMKQAVGAEEKDASQSS